MRATSGVHTIGVAISIPPPYGEELTAWRRWFGDPLAASVPPHITLLPPTDLDRVDLDLVEEHLSEVAVSREPFVVHLRGTATFRPVSPVVFVALARGISDCETLSKAIRTGPLPGELHFPYHPHVTVAQELPEPVMDRAFEALSEYEADFVVDAFGLYQHGTDGVWRKYRDFTLGGPEAAPASRP